MKNAIRRKWNPKISSMWERYSIYIRWVPPTTHVAMGSLNAKSRRLSRRSWNPERLKTTSIWPCWLYEQRPSAQICHHQLNYWMAGCSNPHFPARSSHQRTKKKLKIGSERDKITSATITRGTLRNSLNYTGTKPSMHKIPWERRGILLES